MFPDPLPNVMPDQFGDAVYFHQNPHSFPRLQKGEWTAYDVDVVPLSVSMLNHIAGTKHIAIIPADYFISIFFTGWEIWGGYDTEVEMKSLHLTGIHDVPDSPTPTDTVPTPTSAHIPGDLNGDGKVDTTDYDLFVSLYRNADPKANMNGDGTVNIFDYNAFVGFAKNHP